MWLLSHAFNRRWFGQALFINRTDVSNNVRTSADPAMNSKLDIFFQVFVAISAFGWFFDPVAAKPKKGSPAWHQYDTALYYNAGSRLECVSTIMMKVYVTTLIIGPNWVIATKQYHMKVMYFQHYLLVWSSKDMAMWQGVNFPGVMGSCVNSLWPSDVIWRQGSRSTLAQVMDCCLTAPSHYLNQYWLIISRV